MTITIRTTIDQVTAMANGDVGIRFSRTVEDGALPPEHAVLAQSYHRTTMTPGDAYDDVMRGVLAHLAAMGWPSVDEDDLARAKRIVRAARPRRKRSTQEEARPAE